MEHAYVNSWPQQQSVGKAQSRFTPNEFETKCRKAEELAAVDVTAVLYFACCGINVEYALIRTAQATEARMEYVFQ